MIVNSKQKIVKSTRAEISLKQYIIFFSMSNIHHSEFKYLEREYHFKFLTIDFIDVIVAVKLRNVEGLQNGGKSIQ